MIEEKPLDFMVMQNINKIELKNLFVSDKNNLLLSNINLNFHEGELVGIIGKSGAGKTTILKTIISFDNIKSGEILFNGSTVKAKKDMKNFRNNISYISQFPNLVNDISVLDNINRLCEFRTNWFKRIFWNPKTNETKKLIDILRKFGLENKIFEKTDKLSGGEKQRLLIAIEFFNDKAIIFADEPTSNLDILNSEMIMREFKEVSKNKLIVINIHDLNLATRFCDKLICLENGTVKKIIHKEDFSKGNLNEFFD